MSATDRVRETVAAAVEGAGVMLDGVDVSAAGKRKLVRVTLDSIPATGDDGWCDAPTPALSLDDIADHSRAIGEALDRDEPFGGAPYVLEVSSPGIGRALKEPRQFQRNVSRLLTVTGAGVTRSGRVVRAGADAVVLSVTGDAGTTEETIPYAEIERARVEVEFTDGQDAKE